MTERERASAAIISTAQIRAALRLIGNSDITPAGRRVLESICDEAEGIAATYPTAQCASADLGAEHHDTDHCFCWLNQEDPCCWCGDDSEGEHEQAVCPGIENGRTDSTDEVGG